MSRLTLYAHPKCSTCEAAREWLTKQGVGFVEKDIRNTPPSLAELKIMLNASQGKLSRISNTSGIEYRAQGLAAKLPGLSEDDALRLIGSNGMFVKRPFLIGAGVALAGFKEPVWGQTLPK